jgi:hypothetical protein
MNMCHKLAASGVLLSGLSYISVRRNDMRVILSVAALLLITTMPYSLRSQTPSDVSPRETSCGDKSAKILILGTYHMGNPGQDALNIEADDVLLPKRQREIGDVVEALARFKPTKIAIESAYRDPYWTGRYEKFLRGEYKLGRNEVEQIGFQLAKRLNHSTLYPVDFPMWMNGLTPSEREMPKVKPSPSPTPEAKDAKAHPPLPPYLAKHEELMRTATVSEILRHMNSDQYIQPSHAGYMEMLLPTGSIAIYEQTDLVTNWYKRNLRMFTNINRITEFPGDRILLIVGAGHLKILRDFAIDAPYFCLAETNTYLR